MLLVLVEALVILIFLPTPWGTAVGNGDGAEYQRYAFNLLHHGVFSEDPVAPYFPGVVRSPGYPAFLAAIEWIFGRSATAVQAVQFALVALMAVLVGLIGRELARPVVGNVAAVLCATYLPFLGEATAFLTEVISTCLLTLFVYLLLRARRGQGIGIYAPAGLVLSAVIYIRPEYALIAVPVGLIVLFAGRPGWSLTRRAQALALLTLAVALPLVPWIIRDSSVSGGKFVPMEATGGVTLLISADQWDGSMTQAGLDVSVLNPQLARLLHNPAVARTGLDGAVEYRDARAQIRINSREQTAAEHVLKSVSAGTFVRRVPSRLFNLWKPADTIRPAKGGSVWHKLAAVQYILLILAGLAGLYVRRRTFLGDWPLWLIAAVITVAHLVFNVEARFTLPARAMLTVYASTGVMALCALLLRARAGRLIGWQGSSERA